LNRAFVGLGSNLGEPAIQLRRALGALDRLHGSRLGRVSSAYRSAPLGPPDQPHYLNAVALLHTTVSPHELLEELQAIEDSQGRRRDIRWGPRTLDLDLLLYDELSVDDARLTLPHPRLHERDFVLYPLREISDANLVLPDGRDLATLIRSCPDNSLAKTGCLTPIQ